MVDLSIRKNNVIAKWIRLGEGLLGDFQIGDLNDIELLRFDILTIDSNGNENLINDASYCTRMSVETNESIKLKALQLIMDHVYDEIQNNKPIKKICERLSWISPDWIEKE